MLLWTLLVRTAQKYAEVQASSRGKVCSLHTKAQPVLNSIPHRSEPSKRLSFMEPAYILLCADSRTTVAPNYTTVRSNQ